MAELQAQALLKSEANVEDVCQKLKLEEKHDR